MKAKRLSGAILQNTIRTWGMHCAKDPNYNWTKHDANAMFLLEQEVKALRHEIYMNRKKIEMNPYLDPDQPYHTT